MLSWAVPRLKEHLKNQSQFLNQGSINGLMAIISFNVSFWSHLSHFRYMQKAKHRFSHDQAYVRQTWQFM